MSMDDLVMGLNRAGKYFEKELSPEGKTIRVFLDTKVSKIMKAMVQRRFRTETSPSGRKWKELGEYRTIQKKKKGTLGRGILTDSGKLRRSFRTKTERRRGISELIQYSTCPYAWVHQFPKSPPQGTIISLGAIRGLRLTNWPDKETGKVFKKVVIPERPFLGFDKESLKKIDSKINSMLKSLTVNFLENFKKRVSTSITF